MKDREVICNSVYIDNDNCLLSATKKMASNCLYRANRNGYGHYVPSSSTPAAKIDKNNGIDNCPQKMPHKALPNVAIEKPSADEITAISPAQKNEAAGRFNSSALDGYVKVLRTTQKSIG